MVTSCDAKSVQDDSRNIEINTNNGYLIILFIGVAIILKQNIINNIKPSKKSVDNSP